MLSECLRKELKECESYKGLSFSPDHNGDLVIFCGGNGGLVHKLCLINQNKITFNGWLSSSVVNASIRAMKLWCDEVMLYQRGYSLSQCKRHTRYGTVLQYGC